MQGSIRGVGQETFPTSESSRDVLGPTQTPIKNVRGKATGTRGSVQEIAAAGADGRNEWSCLALCHVDRATHLCGVASGAAFSASP